MAIFNSWFFILAFFTRTFFFFILALKLLFNQIYLSLHFDEHPWKTYLRMINFAMRHLFYSIRNPKLETTRASKSSKNRYPLIQGLTSLFCKGHLVWPDQVKHPYMPTISRSISSGMEMCPIRYYIRLGLMHEFATEWRSLKETGADEQGNQLTAEENHDCCSLHQTLLQNKLMIVLFSLYWLSWRKN